MTREGKRWVRKLSLHSFLTTSSLLKEMFHVQIENLMLFLVSLMYSLGTKCSIKEEEELVRVRH